MTRVPNGHVVRGHGDGDARSGRPRGSAFPAFGELAFNKLVAMTAAPRAMALWIDERCAGEKVLDDPACAFDLRFVDHVDLARTAAARANGIDNHCLNTFALEERIEQAGFGPVAGVDAFTEAAHAVILKGQHTIVPGNGAVKDPPPVNINSRPTVHARRPARCAAVTIAVIGPCALQLSLL